MDKEFCINFILQKLNKVEILKKFDISLADEYKNKLAYFKDNIPDKEKSEIEKYFDYSTSYSFLNNNLNEILDKVYDSFNSIKDKGLKENNNWNDDIEKYLIENCLVNYLSIFYLKLLKNYNFNSSKSYINNQLLIANPKIINKNFYEIIPKDYFKNFNEKGIFYRLNFLSCFNEIFNEIKLLDNLGKMEYSKSNDKYKFINIYNNIKKEDFPIIESISKYIYLLPNELNSKLNLGFLVHEALTIIYFEQGFNDFISDGGYDMEDNGNSVTLLYFIKQVDYENTNSLTTKNTLDLNLIEIFDKKNTNKLFQESISENKLFIIKSRHYNYKISLKNSYYCLKYLAKSPQDYKLKLY